MAEEKPTNPTPKSKTSILEDYLKVIEYFEGGAQVSNIPEHLITESNLQLLADTRMVSLDWSIAFMCKLLSNPHIKIDKGFKELLINKFLTDSYEKSWKDENNLFSNLLSKLAEEEIPDLKIKTRYITRDYMFLLFQHHVPIHQPVNLDGWFEEALRHAVYKLEQLLPQHPKKWIEAHYYIAYSFVQLAYRHFEDKVNMRKAVDYVEEALKYVRTADLNGDPKSASSSAKKLRQLYEGTFGNFLLLLPVCLLAPSSRIDAYIRYLIQKSGMTREKLARLESKECSYVLLEKLFEQVESGFNSLYFSNFSDIPTVVHEKVDEFLGWSSSHGIHLKNCINDEVQKYIKENRDDYFHEIAKRGAKVCQFSAEDIYGVFNALLKSKNSAVIALGNGDKFFLKRLKWALNDQYPRLQPHSGSEPGNFSISQEKIIQMKILIMEVVLNYNLEKYFYSNILKLALEAKNEKKNKRSKGFTPIDKKLIQILLEGLLEHSSFEIVVKLLGEEFIKTCEKVMIAGSSFKTAFDQHKNVNVENLFESLREFMLKCHYKEVNDGESKLIKGICINHYYSDVALWGSVKLPRINIFPRVENLKNLLPVFLKAYRVVKLEEKTKSRTHETSSLSSAALLSASLPFGRKAKCEVNPESLVPPASASLIFRKKQDKTEAKKKVGTFFNLFFGLEEDKPQQGDNKGQQVDKKKEAKIAVDSSTEADSRKEKLSSKIRDSQNMIKEYQQRLGEDPQFCKLRTLPDMEGEGEAQQLKFINYLEYHLSRLEFNLKEKLTLSHPEYRLFHQVEADYDTQLLSISLLSSSALLAPS